MIKAYHPTQRFHSGNILIKPVVYALNSLTRNRTPAQIKRFFYLRIHDEHRNITMNATVSHNKMPAMIFAISQLPKVLSQITKNLRADYQQI
ncbi:hypothetical protein [Bartonella choladocola]|uniref:hypothetical protein n=1 Tax=Bartonella choladocola TaxID=2750995 RepID=UPI003B51CC18